MQNGGLPHQQHAERRRQRFSAERVLRLRRGQRAGGRQPQEHEKRPCANSEPGIAIPGRSIRPFGGPIKRDRLWFYFTYKYEDDKIYVPSSSFADGSRAYRRARATTTRRHAPHLAGLNNAGQDPILSRSANSTGEDTTASNHAADDRARSLHRRVRPRLGGPGEVDANDQQQAAARSGD